MSAPRLPVWHPLPSVELQRGSFRPSSQWNSTAPVDSHRIDRPATAPFVVGSVRAIGYPFGDGSFRRQSPQWWWPFDRTWFVAPEIDHPWTYLAGPESLVADVLASLPAESTRITPDARW